MPALLLRLRRRGGLELPSLSLWRLRRDEDLSERDMFKISNDASDGEVLMLSLRSIILTSEGCCEAMKSEAVCDEDRSDGDWDEDEDEDGWRCAMCANGGEEIEGAEGRL